LDQAGAGSLVLIDEICSATEPEQGGALAQAVMESLANRGVTALVTTHYERLKALASKDERFANAAVGFDLEQLAPTFRLHLGVPGASAAIDVARRMQIPESVAERAEELSGGGRTQVDQMLREIADERERLMDERTALEQERELTAKAYEETRKAKEDLEKRQRERHEKDYQGAMGALRDARDELQTLKTSIKKRKKIEAHELREVKGNVDRLAGEVAKHAPPKPGLAGKAPSAAELSKGVAIVVPSLGGKGHVLEAPSRGRVLVQIGKMKSAVKLSDVRLDKSKQPAKGSSSTRSYQLSMAEPEDDTGAAAPMRSPDATLDLRGERAHEAVASVDRFIDSSLLCHRDAIFIIHGHGMGALRTAVRGHLEGHPSVTKWRRGEAREGGDGVTVAWLDS
jgi:DNA mismatch repair protein MutS2